MASAAVLLAAGTAVVVGLIVFLPRLFVLVSGFALQP
jgi:diacylglycerol kinase